MTMADDAGLGWCLMIMNYNDVCWWIGFMIKMLDDDKVGCWGCWNRMILDDDNVWCWRRNVNFLNYRRTQTARAPAHLTPAPWLLQLLWSRLLLKAMRCLYFLSFLYFKSNTNLRGLHTNPNVVFYYKVFPPPGLGERLHLCVHQNAGSRRLLP